MLGEKLKAIRKERAYSLEELARRTDFSKSFLSQIENGKNSPSIASLKKITAALEVSIGELFEEERAEQIYLTRKGQREVYEVVKDKVVFEFGASKVPARKMEPLFFTLLPGGGSDGDYSHEGEEFGTVIEGTLLFTIGGKDYLLKAGDSVYFNSTTPHHWSNPGQEVMRAIWVITPPSF